MCPQGEAEYVIDKLYSHHCVRSASRVIDTDVKVKDENNIESSNVDNNCLIVCYAATGHRDDEQRFKTYVQKITRSIVVQRFDPESKSGKIRKVLNITKFSAIIVFIVVLSHEAILILAKNKAIVDPWIFGIVIAVIAALAVFGVDSLMVWREHND